MFRSHAPIQLFPFLMVMNHASTNNYIVGGAVRDLMRGVVPSDYDLVTDIPMAELEQLFIEAGFKTTATGQAHLVLNVHFAGYHCEVSNFRKDKMCDGRHAEVEVATMDEDAHRRDFTVNALYMNTLTSEVEDPTGRGLEDLADNTLRYIGNAEARIKEDWLRVFRFYRMMTKGFKAERDSLKATRRLFKEAYAATEADRVRMELEKMVGLVE